MYTLFSCVITFWVEVIYAKRVLNISAMCGCGTMFRGRDKHIRL